MGLFSGSSTTRTNEKFDTGPSSFQAPYLSDAFGAAKDIYASSKDSPYYQGNTYAGMSSEAKDALAKLKAYASGPGLNTATTLGNLGSQMAGYGAKAGSTLDQFATMAGQDPTEANIAAATAYANNPAISGMIDANARDVTRNLSENVLPGIDRAASAIPPRDKIAAARLILDFTKSKPTAKVEHTVKTAEDLLDEMAEE